MDDVRAKDAKIGLIECGSVNELLDLLSPRAGQFAIQTKGRFIFRGQKDSEWALIPRVYRSDVIAHYKRGMMATLKDHTGQWAFEWAMLDGFMGYCDTVGLSVPGDSMEFRSYFHLSRISKIHGTDNRDWPQDRAVPLMALAQHHGVPTRLLDWSDNPFVACYHAAASVVIAEKPPNPSAKLAIYALAESRIDSNGLLKKVRVPGSTSPNISVQKGSFILVPNSGRRGEEFTPDVKLESYLPDFGEPMLHKITLPQALAAELLLDCGKYGISAASVYPAYDGCARAQMESMLAYNIRAERKVASSDSSS